MRNKTLFCLSILLLYGCDSVNQINEPANNKYPQAELAPATVDNCIQTEGDYLTAHYCVNITNIPNKVNDFPMPIVMRIDQLSTLNKKNQITAIGKWAFYDESNANHHYGYKAIAGDKYYEIDWSKDITYFRIWNKDRTKLIKEEPVIRGPESLVKQ